MDDHASHVRVLEKTIGLLGKRRRRRKRGIRESLLWNTQAASEIIGGDGGSSFDGAREDSTRQSPNSALLPGVLPQETH